MKTAEKEQIAAQTWLFVEYAKAGRREKMFQDEFCMRWLRYMEAQGIIGLTDAGVGLGVAGLTAKGQSIVAAYPTEELWAKHVVPIIAETGEVTLEAISRRKLHRVIWGLFLVLLKWVALLTPVFLAALKLRSCTFGNGTEN